MTGWAHDPITSEGSARWVGALNLLLLGGLWVLYLVGQRRHAPPLWRAILFHVTTALALITLMGPLDHWAETSTSAHMVQHMLIMVIIGPFWVLSRPFPQWFHAGFKYQTGWHRIVRISQYPLTLAYAHAAAIWFWHLPRPYMLAVENPWWHWVEHLCFLLTAVGFWWAVLLSGRHTRPFALLAVLFTLMHTGFLGAVLTFANTVLYGEARSIQDQQLAGLSMWVGGGIPYLIAAVWVGHQWLSDLERRLQTAEIARR
ncbi:MAG: cytochrome c oxidase assembly protein [Saccharospirillum sp.]|nr:cytochrome c oxidase assembly protein [Saccharospirillum sp.]